MKTNNKVVKALYIIGIIQIVSGFVSGFYFGKSNMGLLMGYSEFSWFTFLFFVFSGIFSGMMFIGFAEGVRLLSIIANHTSQLDFNVKRVKEKQFGQE